ncbi:hypothetical protein ACHQM5_009290 [Ranunculus cassubicifolius]
MINSTCSILELEMSLKERSLHYKVEVLEIRWRFGVDEEWGFRKDFCSGNCEENRFICSTPSSPSSCMAASMELSIQQPSPKGWNFNWDDFTEKVSTLVEGVIRNLSMFYLLEAESVQG